MAKKNMPFMKRVKLAWVGASKGIKKLVGKARDKVDLDSQFSRLAQKWDRISTGMVRLDPSFLGIFDREAMTLTIRAEGSLEKGELVESDHVQYRIEGLRPDQVQLPLELEHVAHLVPCRVAVLAKI